jgi:UDP-N-acetylmuramoyl-L-alanyl-D-glutamate--2,6-diaminopimelate ligase
VVTSDNPRGEDPAAIAEQVRAGMPAGPLAGRVRAVMLDRGEAIGWAVSQAADADVVLVAGKGHETWQEVGDQRLPFSDVSQAQLALARRAAGAGHGSVASQGVAA